MDEGFPGDQSRPDASDESSPEVTPTPLSRPSAADLHPVAAPVPASRIGILGCNVILLITLVSLLGIERGIRLSSPASQSSPTMLPSATDTANTAYGYPIITVAPRTPVLSATATSSPRPATVHPSPTPTAAATAVVPTVTSPPVSPTATATPVQGGG